MLIDRADQDGSSEGADGDGQARCLPITLVASGRDGSVVMNSANVPAIPGLRWLRRHGGHVGRGEGVLTGSLPSLTWHVKRFRDVNVGGRSVRGGVAAMIIAGSVVASALTSGCGASAVHHAAPGFGGHDASAAHGAGRDPVLARLGLPAVGPGSPLPGYLLIADRDNNRLVIVNPRKRVVWRFPRGGQTLSQPDDAFVSADGRYISTNQEFAETIALISLSRHPRIVWRYGHTDVQGSAPGYLAHPDDAYLLANGEIQVADIINCRVLWMTRSKRIVRSLGSAGNCAHAPPGGLGDPNGDTPLPDGGVLVTEIGGWVDRFGPRGRLLWSRPTPTDYPSDAQLLQGGDVLVAAYTSPGRIDIIGPRGRIVWTYGPSAGGGSLDHPSLAVPLPNGMIAATDDFHHRVVVIDPASKRIVWQYGHSGVPGSAPGYLNNPDGLDLLP